MQLRYLQTLTEIGAEQNSTVVFPMPIDIVKPFLELLDKTGKARVGNGDGRMSQRDEFPAPLANLGPLEASAGSSAIAGA